ncbi:MAG: hypothetical protein IIA60_11930 [Candidatus Marinimicrobia bacterium]|nr:hypothetical protein [Candidatus Neomarinimicrobiota bacterium]
MMDGSDTNNTPISSEPDFPNLDASSDDELKELADDFREALHGANIAIRGYELAMGEERRKARWRRRKDRRIIECWRNAHEEGRGKFIFIITQPTFEQIIQYIEDAGGYSAKAVVDVLHAMFFDGASFTEIDPEVTRNTVNRQLRKAFKALDLNIGNWKQPGLWTITTSHRMLRDAEVAEVDLGDYFLVV